MFEGVNTNINFSRRGTVQTSSGNNIQGQEEDLPVRISDLSLEGGADNPEGIPSARHSQQMHSEQ